MSKYYDRKKIERLVRAKRHREVVGGLWDQIGELQVRTLLELGLKRDHRLLDVGCGSLRLGSKIVDILAPANYFGTDLNESLLEAGYDKELRSAQKKLLPRENLICHDATQSFPFNQTFDFVIAFSLFTHLNLTQVNLTLHSIAKKIGSHGLLAATFFICPDYSLTSIEQCSGIFTDLNKDPFHVSLSSLNLMAKEVGLEITEMTEFEHPRGQRLFCFRHRSFRRT